MIDKEKLRDQLKKQRNLLFDRYLKRPTQASLAIEIKSIDDQVAELTEHLVQHRKSGRGADHA